jgi:hypothetical protein
LREPLALDEITSMMLGMAGSELHPVLTRNFIHILRILKNPYRAGKGGLP